MSIEEQRGPEDTEEPVSPPDVLMEEFAGVPQVGGPGAPGRPAPRPVLPLVAAFAGVLAFALAFFMAGFVTHAVLDDEADTPASAPLEAAAADDPSWGPEDAAVTIEAFSDFQCPYCKKFAEETLPRLRQAYGDKVRFIFRDLPLTGIHPVAALAARAAGCAHDQGRFWEYHDLVYANQESLTEASLNEYASDAGLDRSRFDQCLASQEKMADVLLDMQDAQRHGVSSTPSFVINGMLISGAQPYELFAAVIDQVLAAQ